MAMKRTRVIIIEPAYVVAAGVEAMLLGSGGCDVVAKYRTVQEAEAHAEQLSNVDIIIASTSYGRQMESSEMFAGMSVVGLQSALSEADMLRGFVAVVSIFSNEEELLRTLREAHDTPVQHNYAESHDLSERERDVLVLVAKGYTNKEIAQELFISPHTVISHRKNIVHKTGIRSVAGLTVYAVLNKLIDSEIL